MNFETITVRSAGDEPGARAEAVRLNAHRPVSIRAIYFTNDGQRDFVYWRTVGGGK